MTVEAGNVAGGGLLETTCVGDGAPRSQVRSHAFTEEQRAYLESLPAVADVRGDAIHYTDEFRCECIERYAHGESPAAIFRSAGLDPSLVGYKRIERAIARWRRDRADAEPEQSSAYRALRQENARLKSMVEALDGLAELADARSNATVRKHKRFELVERLRARDAEFNVAAACEVLGVSTAGYYAWRSHERA